MRLIYAKHTKVYAVVEIVFVAVFLFARFLFGVFVYTNYMCLEGPLLLDLVNSGILFISALWIVVIITSIGTKLSIVYKNCLPLSLKCFIGTATKLNDSVYLQSVYYGGIALVTTIMPLISKLRLAKYI